MRLQPKVDIVFEQTPETAPPAVPQPTMLTIMADAGRVARKRVMPLPLMLLFGILLPIVAVVVELTGHICAMTFYDPLPTPWHTALYLCIPVAVTAALMVANYRAERWLRVAVVLNGMAIGIAGFYTLMFLPILPIALLATLILIGFCGLSPLLALLATLSAARGLAFARTPRWLLWAGVAAGLLAILVPEIKTGITVAGMKLAVSSVPAERLRGMRLLRASGDRRVLLAACYRTPRTVGSLVGGLFVDGALGTDQARDLYFRVTGTPFNAVTDTPARAAWDWRGADDENLGGTEVGGQAEGVSLAGSRLDGSIDADAALGYLEWTMTFRNCSTAQQEARVQVVLPPGGVVSRAVLWINGEPHEAAFAARGHARAAYQEVAVVQRHDPLLVTTCGPDRILVQCFPIPPDGEMRIRLGITAPLNLDDRQDAVLALPRIVETNFPADRTLRHAVWVEGTGTMRAPGLLADHTPAGASAVRGELADLTAPLHIQRNPTVAAAWTPDPRHPGQIILQRLTPAPPTPPSLLVIVLDTSRGMQPFAESLAALPLPVGTRVKLVVAGDAVDRVDLPVGAYATTMRETVRALRFEGGIDNAPALEAAWEVADAQPGGAILWLHGPQPIAANVEGLQQRWQRRPDSPRLYDLQVIPGKNTVLEGLDGVAAVTQVPAMDNPADALRRLAAGWHAPVTVTLRRVPKAQAAGKHTSEHLARLWARDGVERLCARENNPDRERAIALASAYHLVTPATGAVVLESTEQYQAHDLDPASPATVPSVPEPEEWALMLAAAAMLLVLWWRRRGLPGMAAAR
jgi:hypothetical protein